MNALTTPAQTVLDRPLQGVPVWLSGPRTDQLVEAEDLLRSIGALPLDRVLASLVDGDDPEVIVSSVLSSGLLVHVGAPDLVDLVLADAVGVPVVDMS